MTPSLFSQIIGNERVLSYLERSFAANRLAHAYLFEGMEHLGKATVAEIFAGMILGAPDAALRLHPDFIFLELGINEKTGKTKKNIGIDEIRDITHKLSLTPMQSSSKVAIIDGAEALSLEAANALLKTLEEPSGRTFIILVSKDKELLPRTVVSRTQVVRFSPVRHEEIEKGLIARGVGTEVARELAAAAFGAPGLAITWSGDDSAMREREHALAEGLRILASSDFEKIKFVEKEIPERSSGGKERALELLDTWELVFRDMLFTTLGAGETRAPRTLAADIKDRAKNFCGRDIVSRLAAAENARGAIRENVSPRFAVENFLLKV